MEVPAYGSKKNGIENEKGNFDIRSQVTFGRDIGDKNTSAVYDGYPTFRSLKEVPEEYRVYSSNTTKDDDYKSKIHFMWCVMPFGIKNRISRNV